MGPDCEGFDFLKNDLLPPVINVGPDDWEGFQRKRPLTVGSDWSRVERLTTSTPFF